MILLLSGLWLGCPEAEEEPEVVDERLPFDALLEDVLEPSCGGAGCHGATTGAGGLFLEGERAYSSLMNSPCDNEQAVVEGYLRVEPGVLENSFLWVKVTDPLGMGLIMPPDLPLDDEGLDALEDWILDGAEPGEAGG